jgi:pimeloyl-ACP methyl ester carboxylesterase
VVDPLPADRLVDLGTHRLQIHVEGEGAPTVVLDAGITDTLDKLRPLQALLAARTRVLAYNRAGYGESEPGPLPRDAGREADELQALLAAAGLPGPYLLVGHSLGALNVQVFAARYPDAVAGLVLLDPPPLGFIQGNDYKDFAQMAAGMTAEWQAIADAAAGATDPGERARGAFFRMIASEHREMFGETARLAGALPPLGDTPLVVMAAGKTNPAFGEQAEAFQRYWIEQSRALAARSAQGRFVLAGDSSHYLYLDAPQLVAETILGLVPAQRAK